MAITSIPRALRAGRPISRVAAIVLTITIAACGTESQVRTIGGVDRLDDRLDALVDPDSEFEIIGEGFDWSEGPIWIPNGGYLLFSDIPPNTIYRWDSQNGVQEFLKPSGYTGMDAREGEVGSNGLVLDHNGNLVLAQHGDRRIARLEGSLVSPTPSYSTLAAEYDSARFNSPNDLVYHSTGALYFTDPPYGLEHGVRDSTKELDFQGVYRLDPDGTVDLLTDSLSRPNGIAFSPDERMLYVANSDPNHPIWMAYSVEEDGMPSDGRVLFDARHLVAQGLKGLPDGLKVDMSGNLFATGPGGVLVLSPTGKHLGTLATTQATSNCAFGEDGASLFVTADMYLLRMRLRTGG